MLVFRRFILECVALFGVLLSVSAGIGCYLQNAPDAAEQTSVASAGWSDPETTGSITRKDDKATKRKRGRQAEGAKPAEADAEPSKGWIDPFYSKQDR